MQDDVPSNQPTHGDFVVSQFATQLIPSVEQLAPLLIDVDFGHDLSALMSSTTGSVIDDIYDLFSKPSHITGTLKTLFTRYRDDRTPKARCRW